MHSTKGFIHRNIFSIVVISSVSTVAMSSDKKNAYYLETIVLLVHRQFAFFKIALTIQTFIN